MVNTRPWTSKIDLALGYFRIKPVGTLPGRQDNEATHSHLVEG